MGDNIGRIPHIFSCMNSWGGTVEEEERDRVRLIHKDKDGRRYSGSEKILEKEISKGGDQGWSPKNGMKAQGTFD